MLIPSIICLDVAPGPVIPEILIVLGVFVVSVLLESIILAIFKYESFGRSVLGAFILNFLSTIGVGVVLILNVLDTDSEMDMLMLAGGIIVLEALVLSVMRGKFKLWKSWLVAIIMNIVSLGSVVGGLWALFEYVL